jgi:hypothetical protein
MPTGLSASPWEIRSPHCRVAFAQTRRLVETLQARTLFWAPGFQKTAVALPVSRSSLLVCAARQLSHFFSSGFQGSRLTSLRVLP